MHKNCEICGLQIDSLDRMAGRVVSYRDGEAHAYCRVMKSGVVPDCPLAENVNPRPCSTHCVQAKLCENYPGCNCQCENIVCQIGVAVRALRAKGMVPWEGYIPTKLSEA